MTPLTWRCLPATQLSPGELYAALALRAQVFVAEQGCAYPDADGQDLADDAWHLFGWDDDQLLAYLRLFTARRPELALGRVVVAISARGMGLGHRLMEQALAECATRWPGRALWLSAQAHLQGFYANHGFVACSAVYDDTGIPHLDMRRAAAPNTAAPIRPELLG